MIVSSHEQPSYHELRNQIQQLELYVAHLLEYPSVVLLRMPHAVTTSSWFNPYLFQLSHSLHYSTNLSPLNSPVSINHMKQSSPAVSSIEHWPQQPLADLTNSSDDKALIGW